MAGLLTFDGLDSRRELWGLLHRLSPRDRVRFLARCCRRAVTPGGSDGVRPARAKLAGLVEAAARCDRADDRLTSVVYGDVVMLCAAWRVDINAVAVELEGVVRGAPAHAMTTTSLPWSWR